MLQNIKCLKIYFPANAAYFNFHFYCNFPSCKICTCLCFVLIFFFGHVLNFNLTLTFCKKYNLHNNALHLVLSLFLLFLLFTVHRSTLKKYFTVIYYLCVNICSIFFIISIFISILIF